MAWTPLVRNICATRRLCVLSLIDQNVFTTNLSFNQNRNLHVCLPQKQQQLKAATSLGSTSSIRSYSQKPQSSQSKPKKGSKSDSDSSDDEHHELRKRGESDFWRRKMRTFHGLLDVNKDGVISYDDYKLLAEKFTALGNLSLNASEEFKTVMEKLWIEQWGEISPYNLVTVEKYLSEMHHVMNDKSLKKKAHRFLPYLFQAVDKDSSGCISLNEYKLFFKCLGLTEKDAATSFAMIDENGDGQLSIKEFVKLGKDYFLTEDQRRVSRVFWGPLVDH